MPTGREDPTLRLVRLALAHPDPPAELTAALLELLPAKRVRSVLGPWNDTRLHVAVTAATSALGSEPHPRAVDVLAVVLGIGAPDAAAIVDRHRSEKYADGVRAAALDLVGEAEGLTGRTVRERINAADPNVTGFGFDAVMQILGLK